ncbi:MAG TPA: protein phosphatase 2C domain-containing protein [Micromonosporaceae bacterium]|nr:protein phosphatase 2C domain-containing protein [Micromonosporaceae bacterium]
MSASSTRVARVRTAERPGSPDRPTEDRIFLAPSAVVVLDGASEPMPVKHDGGWLAEELGTALCTALSASPDVDLTDLLADAISTTARMHQLTPGACPSTTVSIARWYDDSLDILILGDSPIVVATHDLRVSHLRDDRLASVAVEERRVFREHRSGQFGIERSKEWQTLVAAQRRARNRPHGYWIAEADPSAARHALRRRWDVSKLSALMVMTDGVGNGVDRYGVPGDWHDAIKIARRRPADLINAVHAAESADKDGARWPRSKRHDDKALAVVEFAVEGQS